MGKEQGIQIRGGARSAIDAPLYLVGGTRTFVLAGNGEVVRMKGRPRECATVLGAEFPAIRWWQRLGQSLSGMVQAVEGE
ncbi:MAG: hypothetical protein D6723_06980 [Acidobacteria bacterium]|nr:MAG: hypothetical protein D6723_06980 [Acidobacteriota bacterium]